MTDTHTAPDGTVVEVTRDADPRWQMDVPLTSMQLTTPGGLVSTMSTAREVQLSNPADPLSLTFQRELVTVNGRTHEREYEAATRTFFSRTPEGRTATTAVDAQGRVVEWAPALLTPVQFTYSATGLLTAITQGARQSTIAYDADRRPAT